MDGECTRLFIRGGSQEIFIFRFPHHSYKLSRFALQGFGPVTVRIKIPEELEVKPVLREFLYFEK